MIAQHELRAQVLRRKQLSQEACLAMGEPVGTVSEYVRYWSDESQWVVEVHQYSRPGGDLGASGRPDPKRLRLEGVLYIAWSG
jgi:hypothetical protein